MNSSSDFDPKALFEDALHLAFPRELRPGSQPPRIADRLKAFEMAQMAFALHRGASAARLCGRIARSLNRHDLARCYHKAFVELSSSAPDACFQLGEVLIELGQTDQGLECLNRGFTQQPGLWEGPWRWTRLRALPSQTDWVQELRDIEYLLDTGSGSYVDQTHLSFCRAYLLDRLDRFDEAFTEYRVANARKPSPPSGDPLDAFKDRPLTVDKGHVGSRNTPGSRPVFIVGMPRSGTTLIERLLVETCGVYTAGELLDINIMESQLAAVGGDSVLASLERSQVAKEHRRSLYLMSKGAEAVVDKMPTNFRLSHGIGG